MNCVEILEKLAEYKTKLIGVLNIDPVTNITLTSAYSFIIADINNNETHISFEVSADIVTIYELHCPDKTIEAETKSKLGSVTWPGLESTTSTRLLLADNVIKNIQAADSIAKVAVNCTVGDNYRPGSFSKVIYANDRIELQQINYMNAKSLAHKNDYSLRSLVFRIPLDGNKKMITEFSDRSSENNRQCGDNIQAALDWLPV